MNDLVGRDARILERAGDGQAKKLTALLDATDLVGRAPGGDATAGDDTLQIRNQRDRCGSASINTHDISSHVERVPVVSLGPSW